MVMVNQGSGVEIMYPDLYKGLGLKPKELNKYDTPLVEFDGRIVTLEGQINLRVEVNFIVVNAFSPYTAILGRPWIHAIGAVPLTLHQKIKFPMEDGVAVDRANQKMARKCLVVAINHEIKQKGHVDREPL